MVSYGGMNCSSGFNTPMKKLSLADWRMAQNRQKVHVPVWFGAPQVLAMIASSSHTHAYPPQTKRRHSDTSSGDPIRRGPVTTPMKNAISCQPRVKTAAVNATEAPATLVSDEPAASLQRHAAKSAVPKFIAQRNVRGRRCSQMITPAPCFT